MDIYHVGEALVQRQLIAKKHQTQGSWLALAPTNSLLAPTLDAKLENEDGHSHRHQVERPTLLYLFSGTTRITTRHGTLPLLSGNLLFLAANEAYQVAALEAGDVLVTLHLPAESSFLTLLPETTSAQSAVTIRQIIQDYRHWHCARFNGNKLADSAYITERMICEVMSPAQFGAARLTRFFDLLMIELLRQDDYVSVPQSIPNRHVTTTELLTYLDENFDVSSLTTMARTFGYNPNYLSNRLKLETGKSFIQLVDDRRMHAALNLLENPRISVEEIVDYIGYSSKSFFYKKFRQRYGQSPSAMRKLLLAE
ncbi:helix-turn-helix domain-containing protein [Lactiplantibacillus modestisalitolerans]|uniref:Helix-turn-helix domain-containing protein n=1 Tax=Lactiplantibacillus modestisalitolerans TaxID=1457219 RepID=A0ABV5WV06_9LACO|nr:AraC family transcriptional regulator [Lactiplantibacillus modestisalitolerans]